MKTLLPSFVALLITGMMHAQLNTPAPSPLGEVKQRVGLTDITIKYSRPSKKGRTIFAADGLVPYGEIWRTGANAATTIEFSEDVTFAGVAVPKGKYALYSIPGPASWNVMLYSDLELGGATDMYDRSKEVARATVTPQSLSNPVETFLINVGNITDHSAGLALVWDQTVVMVDIGLHTDKQVRAQIDAFAANPLAQVASNYLNAGWYYYTAGEKLDIAADYMKKGVEHSTSPFKFFWMNRAAEVMAATGDTAGAIKMAKAAHEAGMKAPDMAKGFYEDTVKGQIDENLKKWGAK